MQPQHHVVLEQVGDGPNRDGSDLRLHSSTVVVWSAVEEQGYSADATAGIAVGVLHVNEDEMATNLTKVMGGSAPSLALLQTLADNSFDSVLITDASAAGKIIYANKAFKKLTGHDPKSVIGKTPRILQGAGTDPKVISRLAAALKSGGKFEGKAINYKKDGTPFIMFWRVMPIKDGKKIVAWVAIQREGASI